MFRSIVQGHRLTRLCSAAPQRSFVSTVLLSRTWEDETVVDLRKEAKIRGLSTKGNKATLVSRLQEYDGSRASAVAAAAAAAAASPSDPSPTRDVPGATRRASSRAAPAANPDPSTAPQAASPGIRPTPELLKPSASAEFFAFKMPDLAQPAPVSSAQVPYLPDFWDSANPKPTASHVEPELPKLHVVGGAATHHDGGPMHHLEKHSEAHTVPSAAAAVGDKPVVIKSAYLREVFADLDVPTTIRWRPVVDPDVVEEPGRSRSLTGEERTGLYILLGILGGSWLLGGFLNSPPPTPVEEDQTAEQ
ncbi:hypothetical protein ID866_4259 [Astraeus odoratus]|nr:hypothetical protein ID866_4259 [Astraeus odoratus]